MAHLSMVFAASGRAANSSKMFFFFPKPYGFLLAMAGLPTAPSAPFLERA